MQQFVDITLTAKSEKLKQIPNQPIKQRIIQLFQNHFDLTIDDERDLQNDLFHFNCTINGLPFKGTYLENVHKTRPHMSITLECGPIQTDHMARFDESTGHTIKGFLEKEHLPFDITAIYKRVTRFDI